MKTTDLLSEIKSNKEKFPAAFSMIEGVKYVDGKKLKIYSPFYNGYFIVEGCYKPIHRLL